MISPGRPAFLLINFGLFQLGWWVCVLGGSYAALGVIIVVSSIHFALTDDRYKDAMLALLLLAIGIMHDNILVFSGLIIFTTDFAPLWILCLWWLLGLTLRHSVDYIYQRPLLAAIGGAVSAPLAYYLGVSLTSANWGMGATPALMAIGFLWLFILPFHWAIARRLELL